jgi:hypothetical protein
LGTEFVGGEGKGQGRSRSRSSIPVEGEPTVPALGIIVAAGGVIEKTVTERVLCAYRIRGIIPKRSGASQAVPLGIETPIGSGNLASLSVARPAGDQVYGPAGGKLSRGVSLGALENLYGLEVIEVCSVGEGVTLRNAVDVHLNARGTEKLGVPNAAHDEDVPERLDTIAVEVEVRGESRKISEGTDLAQFDFVRLEQVRLQDGGGRQSGSLNGNFFERLATGVGVRFLAIQGSGQ